MAQFNKERLIHGFMTATNCSESKAHQATDAYIKLSVRQILTHLNKTTDSDAVYVSFSDLQNDLSTIMVRGKRYYVWSEFQKLKGRIFNPKIIGNNIKEKLTMADINYQLEELLIAAGDSTELVNSLYKTFENEAVENIPIDMFSLRSYISGNLDIDRDKPSNANKIKKINNYLYHALRIKLIAEAFGGVMPHVISQSSFGRIYYKGPNLQNVPKIVRRAALGTCHEYDIESSVFAWKLSYVIEIADLEQNKKLSMPATLDYLDFKKSLRKKLAQTIFGSDDEGYVNIIKQAITAIGFGAPARASGYVVNGKYEPMALSTIITSPTKLKIFLENEWVIEFIEEQKFMNDLIFLYTKIKHEDELKLIPELLNSQGTLKSNSVISYIYQHKEREIIEYIIAESQSRGILLIVHDCIYTKLPLKLRDIREGIKQFGLHFNIAHEEHKGFAYDNDLLEHQARIAEEERNAAAVFNKPVYVPRKIHYVDIPQQQETYDGSGYLEPNYDFENDPFFEEE
jgi:hypothetical protein